MKSFMTLKMIIEKAYTLRMYNIIYYLYKMNKIIKLQIL